MKKILVFAVVLFVLVGYSSADQSVYVLGGASYGVNFTEGNFANFVIGYEKDFTEKFSISAEFQKTIRLTPEGGNLYSFTPVFRYKFFNSDIMEPYALGGVGVLHQDMGSIFNGNRYGHNTDTEYMFHIVAGVGVEKRFDWLSLISEVRYEHESNGHQSKNDGCDKINAFIGIGINF